MQDSTQTKSPLRLDLVPNDLLTPEDLVAFTGYEDPHRQADVLERNQIRFFRVRDRLIRTTWYHINNPIDLRNCSCHNPGHGRWQSTHGPKADNFPEPDNEPSLDQRLEAFKTQ